MALRIAVCVKQVPDPETPASAFKVDEAANRVVPAPGIPPVVNGFDLHAVEAALRIKDGGEAEVTIISAGNNFVMDVMKKPLSMGADALVLAEDPALADIDAFVTVNVLAAIIEKTGPYDLVLAGRQASDWDQAHVPLGLAERLGLPSVTLARNVEPQEGRVRIERALTDGYQVIEAPLPAVVTVSNELGEPRYPTLRGIMAASRKQPERLSLDELGLDGDSLKPALSLRRLFIPEGESQVEIIEGEDEADAGRKLALRLRELNLI
ncbi:MAG: electron transfer flavoprotein subunit beta/FixA family protein [Chloroflexi bacterium]|nr:electron transfer flavoprotein subunit beta/FixA family protein [Chloroflexota bacterium]